MSTVINESLIWCNISSNLNIYDAVSIFQMQACSSYSLSCSFSWSAAACPEGCSVGSDKHTQTTSEIGIQFSQISLQFALTKAGKHSITVYTGHNNILWSWAQRGEQEFLYLWAILQYKYAKHHNTSGPENQRLEIIASFFFFWKPISQSFQQQTLWKASKGMPFCSSLAMPYYILCTFFLSHWVLRFRHIKAPKGPNCLFFLFFFFPFFFLL